VSDAIDDAIVGSGIVGLALAHALVRRGRRVAVFERDDRASGASIRNFGTLWPVGQPSGNRRTLALESIEIWRDVLQRSRLWFSACGSLHLAYHADELAVLEEFAARTVADGLKCSLIAADAAVTKSPRIARDGLLGALWSPNEIQINPRLIVHQLPAWLAAQGDVTFHWGTAVTSCDEGTVRSGGRRWQAERVWVASGDDLRTLYPEVFSALEMRRCKLQMMRTAPAGWTLGPILAAGLTLGHYDGFAECASLAPLKQRLAHEWPDQQANGIHVLVAQHEAGHLVLGDTHEYDERIDPFDKLHLDDLVLSYLRTFLTVEDIHIIERWHGIYAKHPREPYCVLSPQPGVTAVVGLGGHGMTLSFGLAESVVRRELN
jgi:FAD dependent oxidoreductase TIGR03364